jgi:hypothetical protein
MLKPGACPTSTVYMLLTDNPSPVAVTVKVNQFTTAVELAVSVNCDAPLFELIETGFWLHAYVTPLGKPVNARETEPVNPPPVEIVNTSVALLPWVTGI